MMKNIKQGKIIFDRSRKCFIGRNGESISSFDNILPSNLYPMEYLDKNIVSEFDKHYQINIDIWEIEIVTQTRS